MSCSAPDCTRPVKARGLCLTHYQAARRNGLETRPQVARGEGSQLVVRLSREARALVEEAARRDGLSLAEWVRGVLAREVGQSSMGRGEK